MYALNDTQHFSPGFVVTHMCQFYYTCHVTIVLPGGIVAWLTVGVASS